jgi:hypothetical protein
VARTIYKVQGSSSGGSPVDALPQAPAPAKAAAPQPASPQPAAWQPAVADTWQPTAQDRIKRRKLMWTLISIVVIIVILAVLIFVLNSSDGKVAGGVMGPHYVAAAFAGVATL